MSLGSGAGDDGGAGDAAGGAKAGAAGGAPGGRAGDARVAGIVLAAGAGRRFGGPKALVPGWVADRVGALREGGCRPVLVVLGAGAEHAAELVPPDAVTVIARDWEQGMGASLHAGISALSHGGSRDLAHPARGGEPAASRPGPDAVLIALVDTPGLTAAAVARVVAAVGARPEQALVQATYDGARGHPVLLGRDHWPGVLERAVGDRGARDYLAAQAVELVECGDVATGEDVDTR